MTNLREVAAFLLGEGELDGVGFGDPHPTERGNYWWRKHLRAALAQPEPEPVAQVDYNERGNIQWLFGKQVSDKTLLYTAPPQQPEPEQEIDPDRPHVEDDGCPTEKAVLQRFWREHQKQEPVACPYCHYSHTLGAVFFDQNCAGCVNRMTTPPQREWQGLTEAERIDIIDEEITAQSTEHFALAQAIEAKLKEKNT